MSEQQQAINEPSQPYPTKHPLTDTYVAAQAALASGELDNAERLFAQESADSPCYGLALGYRALTLFRLWRLEEAERAVNVALRELKRSGSPHHPSAVQFMRTRGDVLAVQGRWTEAVPHYEETISIAQEVAQRAPEDADAIEREIAHTRNSLGAALQRLERFDDAIREFMLARDTYRKYPKQAWSGLSESLTNLAEVCLSKSPPDRQRAQAALSEALDVARHEGNGDQLWRTQIKLIQLGSDRINVAERDAIFDAAVEDAVRQNRWGVAYLRRSIEAQFAAEQGRHQDGLRAIRNAHEMEDRLDPADPHPAQLRLTHARLLGQAGAAEADVLRVLIEGAHLWFRRLGRPLGKEDFRRTAGATHDHFRLLSRKLLDAGKYEEAFFAFEAGRTLAYAAEVSPELPAKLFTTSANPFASDGSVMSTAPLAGLRAWIAAGNAAVVVPTVLPPEFVAFVLTADGVRVARASYPNPTAAAGNRAAVESLHRSISAIPQLLSADAPSATVIPAALRDLSVRVRDVLGERPVWAIAPHANLHNVPWRALLRESGVPWRQMPCAIEFSLLLRGDATDGSGEVTVATAVGLGHGDAFGLPFTDEAKAFLEPFGTSGEFMEPCTAQAVRHAFAADRDAAIVSAHGRVKPRHGDSLAAFALEVRAEVGNHTVDAFVDEWLPERIQVKVIDLSACSSGVYEMGEGDYPSGAGPFLLLHGALYCVVCRYPIRATFALAFSRLLARHLSAGLDIRRALAEALSDAEAQAENWNRWRDMACVELLGRP